MAFERKRYKEVKLHVYYLWLWHKIELNVMCSNCLPILLECISCFSRTLQMHVVTFNGKYSSLKEAVQHPDGLSVFGVLLLDRPSSSSPVYTGRVKLSQLINAGSSVRIPASANLAAGMMDALNKADVTRHYYTYSGSLTTPPCSEIVQWIVSKNYKGLPSGMVRFFISLVQ